VSEEQAVNICSPSWDWYDGYGQMACQLAWFLNKNHHLRVNALTTSDQGPVFDNQPKVLQDLLAQPIRAAVGGIMLGYPTLHDCYGGMVCAGPRVAVTMFESDRVPESWGDPLNACEAISVPSRFLVDVLHQSGVRKPVTVHPLGINTTYAPQTRMPGRKPFTFLCLGDRWRRKGWDVAAIAFNAAFGQDPAYKLIIKAREGGMNFEIEHPHIEIIRQDMTDQDLLALLGQVDAYVFPTRGEGFGLPPREAAATGLPVIVTDWGGTADDLTRWAYPLRYKLIPAWGDHEDLRGTGQWAEPDVEHLVEQMRYVASGNPYVAGMAQHSARRVRKLYSWKVWADGVYGLWKKATEMPVTGRRKAWKEKQRAHQ